MAEGRIKIVEYRGSARNLLWALLHMPLSKFYNYSNPKEFENKPVGYVPWSFHEPLKMRKDILMKNANFVIFRFDRQVASRVRIENLTRYVIFFGLIDKESFMNIRYINEKYEEWWPYCPRHRGMSWKELHFIVPLRVYVDMKPLIHELQNNQWDPKKAFENLGRIENILNKMKITNAPGIDALHLQRIGESRELNLRYYEADWTRIPIS